MTMNTQNALEFARSEYDKLKSEQAQRIQFRDNLLMAHLTVVGAIIGFVVANPKNPYIAYAYLLIPWTSSILLWAYLNNDAIISRIRDYIAGELADEVAKRFDVPDAFAWERRHQSDAVRRLRKWVQAVMEFATFILPALGAHVRLFVVGHPADHCSFVFFQIATLLLTAGGLIAVAWFNGKEIVRVKPGPRPDPKPKPKRQPPIPPKR